MKKFFTFSVLAAIATNVFALDELTDSIIEDTITIEGIRYELLTAEYFNVENGTFSNRSHMKVLPLEDDIKNPDRKRYAGVVEILPSINHNGKEYTAYYIGENAFRDCVDLQEVILPEGVTELCAYAFAGCRNLRLTLPQSVKTLGSYVFDGTTFLETPYDFTNIQLIAHNAFAGTEYKHLLFRHGTISFEHSSLTGSEIESVAFEETGDEQWPQFFAEPYAFYSCKLREFRFPEMRVTLGSETFSHCPDLERIIFPNQLYMRDTYYSGNLKPQTRCVIIECPSLKEIVVMSEIPTKIYTLWYHPAVVPSSFSEPPIIDDHSQCVLKVPQGSEELYRADPVWGRFERIEGFAPGEYSGIEESPVVPVEPESAPVYYNLQGMQVKEPVKGQLYIRRTGSKTVKIIL
jgi:hypothetical protein